MREAPPPECVDDRACAEPLRDTVNVCLDFATGQRACARQCLGDIGCPRCHVCRQVVGDGTKHCVPRSANCESPCNCSEDGECPPGQRCNEATGDCAPGGEEDGACPGGLVCVAARCVERCAGPEDCPPGGVCDEGHCRLPDGCITSEDCQDGGTYCDADTLRCLSGCLRDQDCGGAALVCEEGECVAKGCEKHFECGFGQVCRDADCGDADPLHRAECDPDAEGECGEAPNACVRFQDEEGNDLGAFCLVACDDDDPRGICPQGYQCRELELEEGSPERYCTRACFRAPVLP
jgi:hypothetical protein